MRFPDIKCDEDHATRARQAILDLLHSVPCLDLGTLYNSITEVLGGEFNLAVAHALGQLVRDRIIVIEPRMTGDPDRCLVIGIVRMSHS